MNSLRTASAATRNSKRTRRRMFAIMAAALVLALLVTAGFAFLRLQGNISVSALRASDSEIPDSSEGLNVLVLGSDSRDFSSTGFGSDTGSRRSDSMLLVHVSPGNERIEAIQIPRDTVMQRPACADTGSGAYAGGYGMINSALNYGPACSVAAVEALTAVRLDHFIEVDFEGFISIIDALGGVKVCLAQPMSDPKANLDLPAGRQELDGTDALALARTRHAVGDGSDLARLGNQQKVMSAIVQRATSKEVLARPDRLYSFLDATTSSMTVDPQLSSLQDLASLAARIKEVPTDKIVFMTMPNQPAPSNANRVVPAPDATLIFDRIKQGIPVNPGSDSATGTTATEKPASRKLPLSIVNGAQVSGLAGQFANDATKQGYTVISIATAATLQAQTKLLIPDTDDARSTAAAFAKAMNLDIKASVAEVESIELILGQDYQDLERPEKKPVQLNSRNADQDLCG